MNLHHFLPTNTNTSFFEAGQAFFQEELNIILNGLSALPVSAQVILKKHYKDDNAFALMEQTYFLGFVDDTSIRESTENLEGKSDSGEARTITFEEAKESKYNGLMVFAVELNNAANRTQLATLTRAFNRASRHLPVVVLYRNSGKLSIATSERTDYVKPGMAGEKVGKISLLKDIDIVYPHRGHLNILKQLAIPTTGVKAVRNFTQFYYYWQSVFSISVLNKTFYAEIITWFNRAAKDIRIPGHASNSEKHKDFTVRLIARLIFLWFLKELNVIKEELLIPEFDNRKDNTLIKPKNKGTAYYKFILQNLFFNALNSEQQERVKEMFDVYADNFKDTDHIKDLIFYSPYLNGGLFDIHENDWCKLNPSTGKHIIDNSFSVPDHLFLDKEIGLNSILSRYKFTIAENTPLEEEIAVDPEMLGRIFENLLAEQSDDTKEAARKNAGAFYTPRPVVSYMCRSTLLKHLDTEVKPENKKDIIRKLLTTTVLDPACGSGAFPMGMLEEMMQVLTTVDPGGETWVAEMMKSKDSEFREHISEMYGDGQIRYVKKLGLLRNCLFGVDLLDYAIEITKLRCWLSLIVEQRVDFNRANYNLKPLPNLEFKFYKKNSLFRFYKGENLNKLIETIDSEGLLEELVNLENQYFIAKTDHHGTKEEIKAKIIQLLERLVNSKIELVTKEYNSVRTGINKLISSRATDKEIEKQRKKEAVLANELAELAVFRNSIKDYFIERVVFPGIFSKENKNPGFDIVIGNPPYVNTKLINKLGISCKLQEEYGYCDDLYNHFTIRGLELVKKGGLLSYITSDTFLTLQSKRNMRMQFLGIAPISSALGQGELFGDVLKEHIPVPNPDLFGKSKPVQTTLVPMKQEPQLDVAIPECKVLEIINTPKAFSALVDTAIFTLKRERVVTSELDYVDIRKPNASSFNISEDEWNQIKTSKENLAGWERVLDRTFSALGHDAPAWKQSHTCDGDKVLRDANSNLLKFRVSSEPYRKAINYAIFSPTEYNCQILEKIVKPARPVFDAWWSRIETSKQIENNRKDIQRYYKSLSANSVSLIGLLTDGGQGLATGNNGRFVGYREGSSNAIRCQETRVLKLWQAIEKEPKITRKFSLLATCQSEDDVRELLDDMKETEIWELFDGVKEHFGLRIFSKGFMYRVIPDALVFDVSNLTAKQKLEGIKGRKTFVPYDKGDKEGNRWYAETPYLIDWSEGAVSWLKSNSGKSGVGMPVVRNPQFYFRSGFCWSDVLNPNSSYIKCRLKNETVNDVKSMSLYDEAGFGNKYFVATINSYLMFKVQREFINGTVAIQMNDIRKLPIRIPSDELLKTFNDKFDECLAIKKDYIAGEIDRSEMKDLLRPIEAEIDQMVNNLYGIEATVELEEEELQEEEISEVEQEEAEDEE